MLRKVILAASLAAVVLVAACGHDAGIDATVPGDLDPEPDFIGGGVLAPNGVYASAEGVWSRFASLFTSTAHALASNVTLVGSGVSVTLYSVTEEDVSDGEISDETAVSSPQPTDPTGHFSVALLNGHVVGECGLLLSAGAGDTLTRGWVFGDIDQDISGVSEAVVRCILNYIALNPSVRLCDYSASDIEELTSLVTYIASDIGGTSVQDINANVYEAAWANQEMQDLLSEFTQVP
jgi:outer membrane murein-binding lipoprotein Lpp